MKLERVLLIMVGLVFGILVGAYTMTVNYANFVKVAMAAIDARDLAIKSLIKQCTR